MEQPKSGNEEDVLFIEIERPDNLKVQVLGPFDGDDEESDYDHNDLSIVLKIDYFDKTLLYAGDSSSKYWQDRIIPDLLDEDETEDFVDSEILVVSHHGSYTFFGENRDDVREADPEPDNYEALNRIAPDDLIISAKDKFPTSRDKSGDEPPHYAAFKWYHKWFRDNHNVQEDDKHPDSFKYTSESNIRQEYRNNKWKWVDGWEPDTEDDDETANAALRAASVGYIRKPWQNEGFSY